MNRHTEAVTHVEFSDDSAKILTVSGMISLRAGNGDKTARLWDLNSGKQVSKIDCMQGIRAAAISPNGKLALLGSGEVLRILSDDIKGSRHQRFILRISSGQTLLVAHNIDLAPKIQPLRTGDTVEFYGEYEWNNKGGVVHWTHRDPNRKHIDGWLLHDGKRYE